MAHSGSEPAIPFLSALAMLGYGLAGAVSPYLGVVLRNHDPRLPFVISGVVLLVTTLALSKVERNLAQAPSVAKEPAKPAKSLGQVPMFFIASMVILSLGYQLHFSINSTPFFLRFAKPEELQWLMPVFWIGFNLAVLPATVLPRTFGGFVVAACATLVGVAALFGCANATTVEMLVAAQLAAGIAWAIALNGIFSAALDMGRPGHEGLITGVLFSTLAMAALARVLVTYSGAEAVAESAPLPPYAWGLSGVILIALALRYSRPAAGPAPPSRPAAR